MPYELAIIGGGPAGAAAAVYASRKRLKSVFITVDFGGQSIVSPGIENWIGEPNISGATLAEKLKKHILAYANDVLKVNEGEKVITLEKRKEDFLIKTEKGKEFSAKAIFISVGSRRRKLEVLGADKFEHKGLTYCASCDGPMFADQDVVVIGGGNAGFETAAQLLAYCKSVALIHHGDKFKADPITVEKVLANPKMKAILNSEITEIYGDKFVEGIKYKDKISGKINDLKVQGIFVEIGQIPNTDFASGLVELDEYKRIKIDPWTQKTSVPGIWAAGDCTNVLYHQNNIAAGDGVRAAEDIYVTLKAK